VDNPKGLSDFINEAARMRDNRPHPNVVTLLGVCLSPFCIVTEFVPGGSLHDLIHNPTVTLEIDICITLMMDIASGMLHLHSENILHCDLTSRNLLIKSDTENKYTVKVADFGLSHKADESGRYSVSNESKFPVRWSAPEVLARSAFSKASDVWSFGVVCWEILARKLPYYTELSNPQLMVDICEKNLRLPKPENIQFPAELWILLQECWLTDPKSRPDMEAIVERLSRIANQSQRSLPRDPIPQQTAVQMNSNNNAPPRRTVGSDDSYNTKILSQNSESPYNTNIVPKSSEESTYNTNTVPRSSEESAYNTHQDSEDGSLNIGSPVRKSSGKPLLPATKPNSKSKSRQIDSQN